VVKLTRLCFEHLERSLATLTTGGGRSSAPQAATTVRCTIVSAAKPTAVSVTGGA
jgi:hypothetical protein